MPLLPTISKIDLFVSFNCHNFEKDLMIFIY
jgi:hypothetical protein